MKTDASLIAAAILGMIAMPRPAYARAQQPSVSFVVRVDSAQLDAVDVSMRVDHAPATLRLAMKVHPEYDAKYWRHVDGWRIDGSADDAHAGVVRLDSTLWRAALPGGRGLIHYRVHVQPPVDALRRSWQPFMRSTGGLINGPDFFVYLPDFARAPVSTRLELPRGWRVATALDATAPATYAASDAAAFLDSPILAGDLREWTFADRGTRYRVVYWPLPDAAPFDTVSLVDGIRRLVSSASAIFGAAPARHYYFLLQDGASDALEHRASLTMGLPSNRLARDPHAMLPELAHEFFHTWNLVAIHPDSYGALSYQRPTATSGLWMGEGVTLYYADLLLRRAGLADTASSRLAHVADLLARYYAAPWSTRVSPERASLAFGASPVTNADATGGYYLQGELLAHVLDALVRDSTHERRGLDDVMKTLYVASADGAGFTSRGLERTVDSVCHCALHRVFESQIRGAALIDATPVLSRIGLRIVVDTVPATDATGSPLPDRRLGVDFSQSAGPLRLVVNNPASVWSSNGLQTGDALVALGGSPVTSFADYRRALQAARVGDTIVADVQRDGRPLRVVVRMSGYQTPRVRFVDLDRVTPEQRARRERWLRGW